MQRTEDTLSVRDKKIGSYLFFQSPKIKFTKRQIRTQNMKFKTLYINFREEIGNPLILKPSMCYCISRKVWSGAGKGN